MAGIVDHLHMKKNTAGSSNELSLDVLDAARSELDEKERRGQAASGLGKANKGNYHGVTGSSSLSGLHEVEKHKKARRVQRIVAGVGAGVIVVAAIAAVAFAVQSVSPPKAEESKRFDVDFDELIDQFIERDAFLSKVDDVMEDPLSATAHSSYEAILETLPSEQKSISELRERIGQAMERAESEGEKSAFEQLDSAAEARASMLTAAGGTINLASQGGDDIEKGNAAWSAVLDADQMARTAAEKANVASTESEIAEARDLTEQALEKFRASLDVLQSIADRHQQIDLSGQIAYLKVKIEAVEHAVATGDALLSYDRATAKRENELYNERDAEAATLAQDIPPTVEEAVRTAYEQELAVYQDMYAASRDQAIAADAAVRTYLAER